MCILRNQPSSTPQRKEATKNKTFTVSTRPFRSSAQSSFSQPFYTRRENIRTQLIDFRLSGPGIGAAAVATVKYTRNMTTIYETHLSGMEDVQKYGKNTDKKHGARHVCGREAYRARLLTDDVCVRRQKPAY